MTKKILALVVFVFLTSSCTLYHVTSVEQTEAYYPSKASIDEVVYLESVDDKEHTVIGTVTVNGERRQRAFDDVIVKMRREAALIGGDAITDIKSDATGIWKKLPAKDMLRNAYVRSNFSASVIVFDPPSTTGTFMIDESMTEEPTAEDTASEDFTAEDAGSL